MLVICFSFAILGLFDHRWGFGRALTSSPSIELWSFVGCKVAVPPFLSLPESTVPGVLLSPVRRLSFLPLRWAASFVGLRSIPCPIVLSHWASLQLGSFKVFPQALDHLDLDLFPFLNLLQRYKKFLTYANFWAKKCKKNALLIENATFIVHL